MLTFPNAKINIGLSITGKRPDGYHNLETVFYPVQIRDALEIIDNRPQKKKLYVSGLPVAGNTEDNLVWKAYHLLQSRFPQVGELSVYLHKVIPMGAGMGGGSADAAFLLRMLNDYFHLECSQQQLEEYALQLGSDCPFFMRNKPAFASGRGEQLEALDLDLSGYSIQVVYPDIAISTATAFSGIQPKPATFNLKQLPGLPVEEWRNRVFNDFEISLFPQYNLLQQIKEQLYAGGALYTSLSGSGSTLYGIFRKGEKATIEINHAITTFYIL